MPPKVPSAGGGMSGASGGGSEPPSPTFGLHDDRPSGPGKLETLFKLLPFLMRFAKQIPAFASGFMLCLMAFSLFWGRAGIADDIAPYIAPNAAGICGLATFASYYQGWVAAAQARKRAKVQLREGQAAVDVFYRAPKLD